MRDETFDSIDPATGALTIEALACRAKIMDDLRSEEHDIATWPEALVLLNTLSEDDKQKPPARKSSLEPAPPTSNEPDVGGAPTPPAAEPHPAEWPPK